MIKRGRLCDIACFEQILGIIGKTISEIERIEVDPTDISIGYRVFEYNFKVIIPALNGFFRLAYEKEEHFPIWSFIGNVLHFYELDSAVPSYSSHDDLYSVVAYILKCNIEADDIGEVKCMIDIPDEFENVIHCKASEAEYTLYTAIDSINREIERIRIESYTDIEFEVYQYDITIKLPQLKAYLKMYCDMRIELSFLADNCYGTDYFVLYDEETGERHSSCLDDSITDYLKDAYKDMSLADIECIIEMPYRFRIN